MKSVDDQCDTTVTGSDLESVPRRSSETDETATQEAEAAAALTTEEVRTMLYCLAPSDACLPLSLTFLLVSLHFSSDTMEREGT